MSIQKQAGKTLSDRALERVMRDVLNGVWDRSLHDLYQDNTFEPETKETASSSGSNPTQKPRK